VSAVGIAAKQVTAEARSEYPGLAWAEASRMRDRLVHHHVDINLDVLWTDGVDRPAYASPTPSERPLRHRRSLGEDASARIHVVAV
jgi:hypothetical protein